VTEIECEALEWLLRGDHPDLDILREQTAVASIAGREFTGCGFFTRLAVPASAPRLPEAGRLVVRDVYAEVEGLKHGAGFLLFAEGGAVELLECFTHGEDWPEGARLRRLYHVRPRQPGSGELVEAEGRDWAWALVGQEA
jgi:hypothetical protein